MFRIKTSIEMFSLPILFLANAKARAISNTVRCAGIEVKSPIATGFNFHPEY